MFAALLVLLVNACSAMHEREWSDCAVDGGLLHGALGGLAGSPDADRAHQSGTNDGRAAGPGLQTIRLLFDQPQELRRNLARFRRNRDTAYPRV